MMDPQDIILELKDLDVHYGNVPAVKQVSLYVANGEIVSLLGANGAGKTTTLNAIYNLLGSTKGEVRYLGESIRGVPAHQLISLGMGYVTEEKTLFSSMNVKDNLILGAYCRRGREAKGEIARNLDKVFTLFPILKERIRQTAGTLSGGQLQMLSVARALMAGPKLLLLDEPSLGLAPMIISEMMAAIAELRNQGLSVFLVEQNARAALKIADRGYVMEGGRIVMANTADQLMNDETIRSAYLGQTGDGR